MKSACTPSDYRRITRWEHEDVLERMQARLDRMPQAGRLRRQTLEHAFGTLKRMIQVFGVQPLIAAIRA